MLCASNHNSCARGRNLLQKQVIAQPDSNKEFYLRPSYWRPYDQRGINVFETSKQADSIAFEGARVRLGAGFTQQYQNLRHENNGANNNQTTNKLYPLTPGFMTSQANLMLDIQLADGIRLNVTTLSFFPSPQRGMGKRWIHSI
jgi:hypothetical protein